MAILALDTSGPDCAVALAQTSDGGLRILARQVERIGRGHAERLMPMIGEALEAAGCSYRDVTRVAVTVGPGSFTGIRVGIAAARGLALALKVPAVGVGVLDALVHHAIGAGATGLVAAVLDGKRGEVYAAASDAATGATEMVPRAGTADSMAKELAQLADGGTVTLTGSGAGLVAAELDHLGVVAGMMDQAESPDIAAVAELGARAAPGAPASPLYLRSPDAKEQTGRAVARK